MSIHLAVALDGVGWHPGAWREDPENARRLHDADYWLGLVKEAESAAIDFVTIDDTLALQSETYGASEPRADRIRGRLDSVLIASRIAPLTHNIGIIPTVVVTHTEPFHIAKAIATLDWVSAGRAGVRLKVGATKVEADLFGRREFAEFTLDNFDSPEVQALVADTFGEAADYGEVLRRLWDSWEDGAEIRDIPTGRFIDRDKLHYIDFVGQWFSVKGPLTVQRPPQGQPIVSVLGHATGPYELGVKGSDLLYVTPRNVDHAREIVAEVRGLESAAGRTEPIKVLGDVVVILDTDTSTGEERKSRLDGLSGEPLTSDAPIFAGSVAALADLIESWSAAGLDGVRIRPGTHRTDLPIIARDLVPELERRGLRRGDYSSTTLRGNLGLDRPFSRYSLTNGATA